MTVDRRGVTPREVMTAEAKERTLSFVGELEDREKLVSYDHALTTIRQISNIGGERWQDSLGFDAPWPALVKDHGFYTIITQEFMQELWTEILKRRLSTLPAIEVCAGRGVVSHHLQRAGLDIVAIDNGSDDRTVNKSLADNRDGLNHREALEKYQPKLVVGCWIPDVPEIGQDILNFPSVDYFLDIGEAPPNATWLTYDYHPENFKLIHLANVTRFAIGTTDYFTRKGDKLKFNPHTEVRLWKRKGAPMTIDHRYD